MARAGDGVPGRFFAARKTSAQIFTAVFAAAGHLPDASRNDGGKGSPGNRFFFAGLHTTFAPRRQRNVRQGGAGTVGLMSPPE
jgi:hypothetical protein